MRKCYILFVLVAILMTSCAKKTDKKATVEGFFEALEKGDFEKAKELSTPETHKILVVVEEEYKKNKDKIKNPEPIKIEYVEDKSDDKNPKFNVKIFVGAAVKEIIVPIVLVEEKWLVVMPAEHVSTLQFLVFCNQYHIIFVKKNIHIFKSKTHKKSHKKKSHKKH